MFDMWRPGRFQYEKAAIATITQTPVAGTWYTILDTTVNDRVKYIATKQKNDEVGAEDVEVRVTADGVVLVGAVAQADDTWSYWYLTPTADTFTAGVAIVNAAYYTDFRAQSIKVEVRQTSAVGTTPILDGRVQYATLETA